MVWAKYRSGEKVENAGMSLAFAKSQDFICWYCDVPLDVVKMPNLEQPTAAARRRPGFVEFYVRARKPAEHGDSCRFAPRVRTAIIEERVIRSRSGAPGEPPTTIRFRSSTQRQGSPLLDGEDPLGGHRPGWRHVDGGVAVPERGPRATVIGSIERACLAYVEGTARPGHALQVADVDEGLTTYGQVFRRLKHAREGLARIWSANLIFTSAPERSGAVVRLHTFDGRVDVDQEGWRPHEVQAFESEIELLLEHARSAWIRDSSTNPRPIAFALGECSGSPATVLVRDARKLCLLVALPAI